MDNKKPFDQVFYRTVLDDPPRIECSVLPCVPLPGSLFPVRIGFVQDLSFIAVMRCEREFEDERARVQQRLYDLNAAGRLVPYSDAQLGEVVVIRHTHNGARRFTRAVVFRKSADTVDVFFPEGGAWASEVDRKLLMTTDDEYIKNAPIQAVFIDAGPRDVYTSQEELVELAKSFDPYVIIDGLSDDPRKFKGRLLGVDRAQGRLENFASIITERRRETSDGLTKSFNEISVEFDERVIAVFVPPKRAEDTGAMSKNANCDEDNADWFVPKSTSYNDTLRCTPKRSKARKRRTERCKKEKRERTLQKKEMLHGINVFDLSSGGWMNCQPVETSVKKGSPVADTRFIEMNAGTGACRDDWNSGEIKPKEFDQETDKMSDAEIDFDLNFESLDADIREYLLSFEKEGEEGQNGEARQPVAE